MTRAIPDGSPIATPRRLTHRERRLWERYAARGARVALIWDAGAIETTALGRLLNIGGGGAAFAGDVAPPPHRPIWLRPADDAAPADRIEPAESRLVGTSDGGGHTMIAHLEFIAPCAMDLFEFVPIRPASPPPALAAAGVANGVSRTRAV